MAYKFSGELQHDFEYCYDAASGKSLLLVRMQAYDINLDRTKPKYFVAYDVPEPKDNELPAKMEPIEITGEYGWRIAMDMLAARIDG